jgi:hypothetical protein
MATSTPKTAVVSIALRAAAPSEVAKAWDPYEVWRTRVLLPRRAEALRRKDGDGSA